MIQIIFLLSRMKGSMDTLVVDSGTSHTILKDKKFFVNLTLKDANVSTIAGVSSLIKGHGQAYVLLPNGTHLEIDEALYSPNSKRSLLSFKDIRKNGLHIQTSGEGAKEFLNIFELDQDHKKVLEMIPAVSTGLYHAQISAVEANAITISKEFKENFA